MKSLLKLLAAFGILAIVFFAYQQNHETKTKVYAEDFEGEWRGVWNWSPTEACIVTLSGTAAKVKNLPMKNIMDINFVSTLTTQGEVEFAEAYGSESLPCVLVSFSEPKECIPFFLSSGKDELMYAVSESEDKRVFLKRTTSTTK